MSDPAETVSPLLITDNPSRHWVNDTSLTAQQKLDYFNEAVLTAEAYTEQRIINLLEALAFQINSVEHNPAEAEGAYRAAALIKGEK